MAGSLVFPWEQAEKVLRGYFAAPPGPVLLVDDVIDSGWPATVAARLLRTVGASAVLPFALAQRG